MIEKPDLGAPTPEKEKPKGKLRVINETWGMFLGESEDGKRYLVRLGYANRQDDEEYWKGFLDLDSFLTVPGRERQVVEITDPEEFEKLQDEMQTVAADRLAEWPTVQTYIEQMGGRNVR